MNNILSRFQRSFARDPYLSRGSDPGSTVIETLNVGNLLDNYGGSSYNQGLFRIVDNQVIVPAKRLIEIAYPSIAQSLDVFGFDWMGRIFAVDDRRKISQASAVSMIEPGTGLILNLPCDLDSFFQDEILHQADAALAQGFHADWLNSGGVAPNHGQCVGYKRPLFLGGKDKIENLELVDVDVYWTLMAQLIRSVKGAH